MISLVVATVNRVAELERLLTSLDAQSYRDFEVIVVDQNPDDRLPPVLHRHKDLAILHLRSDRGLSRARNVGLLAAKGDILAIPDDDCWYPEQLLASVNTWFTMHPESDVMLGITRNAEGKPMLPKWPPRAGSCDRQTLWSCTVSNGAFWRRCVSDNIGPFNECLGVGAPTRYQSSEEIEYFLRALESGFRASYVPEISVFHSEYQSIERLRRTTYGYALGIGCVAGVHRCSWWFLAKMLARSLGGAAVSLCRAQFSKSRLYLLRAAGQFRGYFWGPRDLARFRARAD